MNKTLSSAFIIACLTSSAFAQNIIRTYAPIAHVSQAPQPPVEEKPFEPSSCLDIKSKNSGSSSGVYNLYLNGSVFSAYCDMTSEGGGWTLVGRGEYARAGEWSKTIGAVNPDIQPSPTATTFKLSDATINALPKTAFKVASEGYANKRFWKGSCQYMQLGQASGDCAISYGTLDWTSPRGNGLSSYGNGGLSDERSSVANDGTYITTSLPTYPSHGWTAGDGTDIYHRGTGAAGTPISISIWIR